MLTKLPYIEAFASQGEVAGFKGARYESHQDYDIGWFVWEKDGIIPESFIDDDWEPLILFFRKDELIKVTVRLHFEWKEYYSDPALGVQFKMPLQVIFEGINHGPRIGNVEDPSFDADVEDRTHCVRLHIAFSPIDQGRVPGYAEKAFFRRKGLLLGARQSVHEKAQEQLGELRELGAL